MVNAREILYKNLPETFPRVVHVVKRDNVAAMYDVVQRLGAEQPITFVCKDLNNVPPLSLKNIDPVMLLQQNSDLRSEMAEMKSTQAMVLSQLTDMKATLDTLCASNIPAQKNDSIISPLYKEVVTGVSSKGVASSCTVGAAVPSRGLGAISQTVRVGGNNGSRQVEHEHPLRNTTIETDSSKDLPVTVGKKYTMDSDGFLHQQRRQRKPPIIGKGTNGRLRVAVSIKRRDIFISRLHEDTTCEDIDKYITEIVGNTVLQVEKLKNKYSGYSSFRVTCDEQYLNTLLSEDVWGEGILVRPFFQARKRVLASSV